MTNQTNTDLPVIFLACKVFEGIVSSPEDASTIFLDYGLHSIPKKLQQTVQEQINAVEEPSLIILGYGLCGNGLHEIEAGVHTLVIPKADDCVSIFMGSRQRYLEQFNANPGTYYLTKGWFEVGSDPLSEYEKLIEGYGQETADWLMKVQYQHYKRLVFVALSDQGLEDYRPRALQVAEYCQRFGMVYEEYHGSGELISQIDAVLRSPEQTSPEFLVVAPGEMLTQEMFF